jgi:hypothetical protein
MIERFRIIVLSIVMLLKAEEFREKELMYSFS